MWDKFNYEYLVLVRPEQKDLAEAILGENLSETIAWENAVNLSNDQLATCRSGCIDEQTRTFIFNRSVAYYHLGKHHEAIADYEYVEAKLPFRTLWYQIEPILAYQKIGNYDRVLSITQKVKDKGNRAFSEAYQIRGEVFEAQGKTKEAEAEFAKVRRYNKNFWKYWD